MRRVIGLRREDGVAMTEFALVLPVFVLLIAGLLAFGRVFFYWIESNHLANETARWAVVDQNGRPDPGKKLQIYARDNATGEFSSNVNVCIDFLGKSQSTVQLGDPVRVRVRMPFNFVPILGIGQMSIRGSSTMRIENIQGTQPSYGPGDDVGDLLVNRLSREERGGIMVLASPNAPGLPPAHGTRCGRRKLVHTQAPTPEPRRRRRPRRGRRVRQELEGMRPDRQCDAEGQHRAGDRRCSAAVRRRPEGVRLRRRRSAADAQQPEIANQSKLNVIVISPTYSDGTDYSDDYDGNAATRLVTRVSTTLRGSTTSHPVEVNGQM